MDFTVWMLIFTLVNSPYIVGVFLGVSLLK
jgi:hypothetical protein